MAILKRYTRKSSSFLGPLKKGLSITLSLLKGERRRMIRQAQHDSLLDGRLFLLLILIISVIPNADLPAQSPMTPKLKEFLSRNDFMELIEKYGEDKISLTIKGVEQKKVEQRSYDIVQGYRCQVFAGRDLDNANEIAQRIRALQLDSVYVVESADNLYKVQVGNFAERKDAQIMLDKLRYAGVDGAWMVETNIHVPKKPVPEDVSQDAEMETEFHFAIQVFNTRHLEKAKDFKAALEQRFSEPVEIIQQNDLWKIVVGQFSDHDSADSLLERMRNEGFTDAWITQIIN